MNGRRLNLLTVASLLLCFGVAVVWVDSYRAGWSFGYYADADGAGHYRDYYLTSARGRVYYIWFWQEAPSTDWRGGLQWHRHRAAGPNEVRPWGWYADGERYGLLGLEYEDINHSPARAWQTVAVPYWLVLALLLVVAAWPARRLLRRRPEGLCVRCGYDLRATPGRCPECGHESGGR